MIPPGQMDRGATQRCVRCVMDTTDPGIRFDNEGVCSHCQGYETRLHEASYLAKRRAGALPEFVARLKTDGRGKRYDCVIGVSGGVDSTYVALLVKQLGLRPVAVHVDNGWNSELAVHNIEAAVSKLGIDLDTVVLDWDSFRDLQVAFLRASTPDVDVAADHAIQGALYEAAARHGVRYILAGTNTATEGGGVPAWSQGHADWGYVRGIHRRFGTKSLKSYPHQGVWGFFTRVVVRRIRWYSILDFVDYDKAAAIRRIESELGWRAYPRKHGESVFTRWFQEVYLPEKFNFDKRILHYSSLIWSGQMRREDALVQLQAPILTHAERQDLHRYVAKKLQLSTEQLDEILKAPAKRFENYPSHKRFVSRFPKVLAAYHRLKRA